MAGKLYYDRKNKVPVVCLAGCAVVSVFGSGDYDWKKKLQSSVWRVVLLCQFLVLAITTGKKKLQSSVWRVVLCCVSFWFWREIGSFFVVAGKFYYDRKKKFQSSVWRVVLLCQFLVLAITKKACLSFLTQSLYLY